MKKRSVLRPISGLLFGCCFLTATNTLSHNTVSALMGFNNLEPGYIAIVMSCYSVGIVFGSLYGHVFIQRVGHIRAFAGICALIGILQIIYGVQYSPIAWLLLRALHGYASAAAYMALESWLHAYATQENRGRIWGVYQTLVFVGAGSVPLLFGLMEDINAALPIAALLIMLALIPMTLSRKRSPELEPFERMPLKKLFAISQTGAVGTFVGGALMNGIMFLLPAYAVGMGLNNQYLAYFLSAATIGGFLLQYPIGRLADNYDKRKIMLYVLGGLVFFCALFLALRYFELSFWYLLPTVVFVGGLASCVYPLSVAESFNYLGPKDSVPAMGTLLLCYSFGSISGPILVGLGQSYLGPEVLFIATIATAVLLAGFLVRRILARTAVTGEDQSQMAYSYQTAIATQAQLHPGTEHVESSEKWLSTEARIAGELAQNSVENAAEIARTVIDSVLHNSKLSTEVDRDIVAQVASEVARNAPEQAAEIVNMLADATEQHNLDSGQELVQQVAAHVAGSVKEGAFEVIEEISKLELVDSMALLHNLAQNKPRLAIRLALEQAKAHPQTASQLVDEVYPHLPEDDPKLRQFFIRAMLARSKDKHNMSAIANRVVRKPEANSSSSDDKV